MIRKEMTLTSRQSLLDVVHGVALHPKSTGKFERTFKRLTIQKIDYFTTKTRKVENVTIWNQIFLNSFPK